MPLTEKKWISISWRCIFRYNHAFLYEGVSVHPFTRQSVYLSVRLSVRLSVGPSVGPSVSPAMSPRSNIVYFFRQIFSVEFDFFLTGMKNCRIHETFIHVHLNPYILILS